jgi:DNA-binding NarL/FixJ family response regulator
MMMNIRVAILDDNPVYLHAMVKLLSKYDEFDVVIVADNFRDFLDELSDEEPELIMIDDSVFNELRPNIRMSFMKYVREIPVLIMGLKWTKELEKYKNYHPDVKFLDKESGSCNIIENLLYSIKCGDILDFPK